MRLNKQSYARSTFVLHGLLLAVVLASAYVSGHAQYRAMRDQQIVESRARQQVLLRAAAQILQQNIRVLLANSLNPQQSVWPDDVLSTEWIRANAFVDRKTGQVVGDAFGYVDDVNEVVTADPGLLRVKTPLLRSVIGKSDIYLVLSVPAADTNRVRLTIVSRDQLTTELGVAQPRAGGAVILAVDDHNRIVAASDNYLLGTDVRAMPVSKEAAARLRPLTDAASDDQTPPVSPVVAGQDDNVIVALQTFEPLPGTRWTMAVIREDAVARILLDLRPLVWQLVSGASVMVLAVLAVLISTTMNLSRGRRRIEKIRMEMINRDLEKARRIQLNWLPKPHYCSSLIDIAAVNKPTSHISGDFYNWFELPSSDDNKWPRTAIVIGDVSGHGLPAAFLMATAQMIVRNTLSHVREPGLCLTELNRQLCSLVYNGQFVTMLIMVIDHETGGVEIASAGQSPPLLRRVNHVEPLDIDPELVAGVDVETTYTTARINLEDGDMLLLYTDGVVEALNHRDEQFGLGGLQQSVTEAEGSPDAILKKINRTLELHHGGEHADDDVTMVALRISLIPHTEHEPDDVPHLAQA